MAINPIFVTFEFIIYLMFLVLVAVQFKKKKSSKRLFELGAGVVFGVLLEIINMAWGNTYEYGPGFLVYFFGAPLAIGVAWSILFHIAMSVSDVVGKRYKIPQFARPIFDSLLIVSADISLDVLAIRLGFWSWLIPNNAEWFGVPYENFAGWILVALAFSFTIRFVRWCENRMRKEKEHSFFSHKRIIVGTLKILSPIISYVLLALLFVPQTIIINSIYQIKNYGKVYHNQLLSLDKNIIYSESIASAKAWLFLAFLVVIFSLTIFFLNRKKIWQFARELKKENFRIGEMQKNFDLYISCVIMLFIQFSLLISIFAMQMHKEIPLIILVQVFVIGFNVFAFVVAFNAQAEINREEETKTYKIAKKSGKKTQKTRFKKAIKYRKTTPKFKK